MWGHSYVEKLKEILERKFEDVREQENRNIGHVTLCGGGSRFPPLQEMVNELIRKDENRPCDLHYEVYS